MLPPDAPASLPADRRRRMPPAQRLKRNRRARHLQGRLPHPPRPEGLRPTLTATSTGTSTWTSTTPTSTIELTPGATDGVLFDGMTADGSKVFFTPPKHHLDPPRSPTHGADIYQAEVSEAGATLTLISTGSEGNRQHRRLRTRLKPNGTHWNTVGAPK